MKKTSLIATIICGMMATGTAFSQHSQSLSFTPSGTIFNQNDTFTVDTFLTFEGYSAYGFFYWLETAGGTQSFFHITAETFLTFNDPNDTGWPNEFNFPMTNGVDAGYMATSNDLGATTQPLTLVPPGIYHVSHITFSITGAAPGVYTFYSTTSNPRPSEVGDQDLNDNPIPRASFTITVVPGCPDDTWTPTSITDVPSPRDLHTAIWTGSEMIVWGGSSNGSDVNTGGRYNPATDSWTASSTTNAPAARSGHTAVWTGTEMIVWGGFGESGWLNSGGKYNPSTDTWTATSRTNAPSARAQHTAVWTGNEMIVWGGYADGNLLNTGGRYNPSTDSWTATTTTNAPAGRYNHTAVWTGGEMIVWGGNDFNTGGRYNLVTNSWTATSITNAPTGRIFNTAVWTGSEMIVWGGYNGTDPFDTGGRYNASTDTWIGTTTASGPTARYLHTAVWTGSEMIVWGGFDGTNTFNTGGRYCAKSPAPVPQSAFSRKSHGAAGTFDIPLPLTSNVGVECRRGGATNDYQIIINFMNPVTVGSASVTSGTGSVSGFSVSGTQVTVNLTGITNVQRITVTLFDVNDGTHVGDVAVSMGVLVGDVNGNGTVNASDVSLDKSQVGQPVMTSNFREDVSANGVINSVDVVQVKAEVGTALPP